MHLITASLATATLAYGLVAAGMYAGQRSLLYRPDATRVDPRSLGLQGVTERELEAPDGVRIVTWVAKAAPGKPTILYFHGNGGNLAGRAERVALYRSAGYGLLMLSYRGFSGSGGSPSEMANAADAQLAYDRLIAEGARPQDIVVYGESLGTGVSTRLCAERQVAGLILDAPYTSLVEVAAGHYPWLPVRMLLRDRYESIGNLAGIHAPLLVLHGAKDDIVPVAMGQAMYAAANEPKKMVVFAEAGHLYHTQYGSFDVIRAFIDGLPRTP